MAGGVDPGGQMCLWFNCCSGPGPDLVEPPVQRVGTFAPKAYQAEGLPAGHQRVPEQPSLAVRRIVCILGD